MPINGLLAENPEPEVESRIRFGILGVFSRSLRISSIAHNSTIPSSGTFWQWFYKKHFYPPIPEPEVENQYKSGTLVVFQRPIHEVPLQETFRCLLRCPSGTFLQRSL